MAYCRANRCCLLKKDAGEESMITLTVAEAVKGDQDREGHYGRRL
jgi:hypothetical protein